MSLKRAFFWKIILVFILCGLLIQPVSLTLAKPAAQSAESANYKFYLPFLQEPLVDITVGWPMAGANPQRTSWVSEEVNGSVRPLWFKKFEAYISPKTQIIAAYGMLYVATANGLYALDADSGAEKWVYPTEMPLGNSPTIYNGVAYVGGFDHKLHAIDANDGSPLWTFEAGAGFDTNPLVANDLIFMGNRDGYFYAVDLDGQLAWKYKTDGPISFSAAYQDGQVYFASQDSYAYALNARSGALLWKSEKLPGAGFQGWWPVVYKDWVIFSGSANYMDGMRPGASSNLASLEKDEIFPQNSKDPRGTLAGKPGTEAGSWAEGTVTIDMSKPEVTANGSTLPVTKYLENKPYRRTYIVLNRSGGSEYTSDFDKNGKPEYAPILWQGTHSGNRFPPVVGIDEVLYQSNVYMSDPYIAGGQISGWQPGTPYISVVSSDWNAADEPLAYSAGGRLIYWNLCCDREAGSFDVTRPDTQFATRYNSGVRPPTDDYRDRERYFFAYNLDSLIPGYSSLYYGGSSTSGLTTFGGRNGVYGEHGLQNPPIPYKGKLFMHRSNTVIAFSPTASKATELPMAKIAAAPKAEFRTSTKEELKTRLADEVHKIIQAGHLRPGYYSTGFLDFNSHANCGDDLLNYWHAPGDTLETLIRALPYLPADLQQSAKTYLQSEFAAFSPAKYSHIGWKDGAARETFILPADVDADRVNLAPQTTNYGFTGWTFPPQSFYAMWKYAQTFSGTAPSIYSAAKSKLNSVPATDYLIAHPEVLNAYIAGYTGYLELQKLAGVTETASVRQQFNTMLALRLSAFSKDNPQVWFDNMQYWHCRAYSASRNFMFMEPEVSNALRGNASSLSKVQQAIEEYTSAAPYWFETKPEATFGEGAIDHYYNRITLLQARAQILRQPYGELVKYLDVPAAPVGDLFYIQSLVILIEANP